MPDLLGLGTDRGYSMIGVGLSATLSGGRKARVNLDPMPALDLNFAANRSLPADYGPTPSFSRASTGTFFNSSGVLTSAAVNVPRFDHVYSGGSWVSRGLLVEEQRTNSLQRSEEFSNAYWLNTGFSAVSANVAISPDGLTTADKLVEDSVSSEKVIYKDGFNLTGPIVVSCFMKAAGRNYGIIQPYSGNNGYKRYTVVFDLTNGSVTATRSVNSPTGTSYGSSYAGDGWWRC